MNERLKELAEQAGFNFDDYYDSLTQEEFIHFVELVRADEREVCAKLCENLANNQTNQSLLDPNDCAVTIRLRNKK